MFYLFGTAILLGAAMIFLRMRGQIYPPWSLSILHGMFAIGGLAWIIIVFIEKETRIMQEHRFQSDPMIVPLIAFCAAAALGFFLMSYHIRKRPLPIPVVVIHGLIAFGAFVWLLIG